MKLSRVQRVMLRRLAWLTAKAGDSPASSPLAEERDALSTLLRCQGMLDESVLAKRIVACEDRVLPAEQRTKARARRGDEVIARVEELVDGLVRAMGVA